MEKIYPQSSVIKKGDGYALSGVSFGTFIPWTPFNFIRFGIQSLLSRSLLTKYYIGNEIRRCGFQVAKKQNRILSFDCIRQIFCVDLLFKRNILRKSKVVAVIGDGYGFMSSLIKMVCPESTVICINLGKILFFDIFYSEKVMPNEKCVLVNRKEDFNSLQQNSIFFVEAEKYDLLFSLPIDLFINIVSMQEMDKKVISRYYAIMRSSTVDCYLYSCNRVSKELPGGEVIRFDSYPWDDRDEILVDGECLWHRKTPSSRPPFWQPINGSIKHRLVRLYRRKA